MAAPTLSSDKPHPRSGAPAGGPLAYALDNPLFSDVTLVSAQSKLPHRCHKVVLATVPYLFDALTKHVEEAGAARPSASRGADNKDKPAAAGSGRELALNISEDAIVVLLRYVYQLPFDGVGKEEATKILGIVEELAVMRGGLVQTLWGHVERAMRAPANPGDEKVQAELLARYVEAAATLFVKHSTRVSLERVGTWVPWRVARSLTKEAIVYLVSSLASTPNLGMLWALAWCAVHPALTHEDFDGLFGPRGIVEGRARLPGKRTLVALLSHCQSQLVVRYVLGRTLGAEIPLTPRAGPEPGAVLAVEPSDVAEGGGMRDAKGLLLDVASILEDTPSPLFAFTRTARDESFSRPPPPALLIADAPSPPAAKGAVLAVSALDSSLAGSTLPLPVHPDGAAEASPARRAADATAAPAGARRESEERREELKEENDTMLDSVEEDLAANITASLLDAEAAEAQDDEEVLELPQEELPQEEEQEEEEAAPPAPPPEPAAPAKAGRKTSAPPPPEEDEAGAPEDADAEARRERQDKKDKRDKKGKKPKKTA